MHKWKLCHPSDIGLGQIMQMPAKESAYTLRCKSTPACFGLLPNEVIKQSSLAVLRGLLHLIVAPKDHLIKPPACSQTDVGLQ
jgi:hypothetical protein